MQRRGDGTRRGVLVAAEGHDWEPEALAALAAAGDLVTLRRCLDLTDLLAVAASDTAQVAVVAATPGLDRDLVERLATHQVVTVAVTTGGPASPDHADETDRLHRLGVATVLSDGEVSAQLVDRLRLAVSGRDDVPGRASSDDAVAAPASSGRVMAVWGPTGAPGRTTVAVGLAGALARAGRSTILVDADPYGGAVGQHLGMLDETSGLLAAARHANSGTLTPDRVRAGARSVAERLDVLTGLPRPDRWTEVRARNLTEVVDRAAQASDSVVVDAGFGADVGPTGAVPSPRSRDALVTAVLRAADEVTVVGAAEPVGLTRLARLLVDCRQLLEHGPSHVVVNRMRPGLGWRESEIVDMVARVCPAAQVHFVPFDLDGADRAMQSGRSPVEAGPSRLCSGLLALGAAVTGSPMSGTRRRSLLSRA